MGADAGVVQVMAQHADVAVTHNASFDRHWLGHLSLPALTLPWVCTCCVLVVYL